MKAVLTDERFSRPGLDLRAQARRHPLHRDHGRRAGAAAVAQRPAASTRASREVAEALERRPGDATSCVDGEVVAFDGAQTSFAARCSSAASGRCRSSTTSSTCSTSTATTCTALPLRARKALLRDALAFDGPVRFTPHRNRDGEEFFREACRKGWEGADRQARRRAVHPRPLARLAEVQVRAEQELVIGGYTAPARQPHRARRAAARLLRRTASCATPARSAPASPQATLRDLGAAARARCAATTRRSPTTIRERARHLGRARLVAQVGFTEWTRDGRLRHPRFLGLRDDKAAREVVREAKP